MYYVYVLTINIKYTKKKKNRNSWTLGAVPTMPMR